MLYYLSLDRPPAPSGPRYAFLGRRGLLNPVRPWVARVENGRRQFVQPLANWRDATPEGDGIRAEYYLDLADGDLVEVNAPKSWCEADRYRAVARAGRLERV